MAEVTISATVGAPGATNRADDVRVVQRLLQNVWPPIATPLLVTGVPNAQTVDAIREFQSRFMRHPDGRVEPDGRTLMHLNDGFASNYIGCNPHNRVIIDRDIIEAQKWLDIVNRRLANPGDLDARQKLGNIFHLEAGTSVFARLQHNFLRLRQSLDEKLTFKCEKETGLRAAWVSDDHNDPMIHLAINYFGNKASPDRQSHS